MIELCWNQLCFWLALIQVYGELRAEDASLPICHSVNWPEEMRRIISIFCIV